MSIIGKRVFMTNVNDRKIYNAVGAEAVLTAKADLRKYLTGISTSAGYVLSDSKGTVFYTDTRYIEAAAAALEGTGIKVELYKGSLEDLLKPYSEIAIPLNGTLYNTYVRLRRIS